MGPSDKPEPPGASDVIVNGSGSAAGPSSNSAHTDVTEALKELSKGEQTATALEKNLTSLENKLDMLLASLEGMESAPDEKEPAQLQNDEGQGAASGSGGDKGS